MNRSARVVRCLSWLSLLCALPALAAAPACPTIGVGPASLPDGVVGTAYTQTLDAATGSPPVTFAPTGYSVDSGVLPTGLAISAGQLTGTPTATGAFDFSISASDAAGCSGGRIYRMSVMCGVFTIATPTDAVVGTAYSQTLAASGGVAPYSFALDAASPLLPTGLTLATDGVLSGTPQAGSGGSYGLQIDVTDAASCTGTPVPLTLVVDEAAAFTSANATSFTVGTNGTFNVTATGYPTPTLSTASTLPAGVTFDALTGLLSGTPAAGTAGTYPITFSANNVLGTTTQSFTLTVNEAPAITSTNAATFTAGNAGTFTVTTTGSPTPTLSMTGTLPGGVTFTPGTGVLAGTPAAGSGGVYALVFTASNGVGADATQNFTLTVNEVPTITSANATAFALNAPSTFTVTATGYPAPTFSETGPLPAGITLNASTGVLSGTPTNSGSFGLTLTAINSAGTSVPQSFTLAVTDPAAITSANTTTFTVGSAGTFTITATGSPTPTLGVAGSLPTGVSFDAGTGVLSGTPAAGTGGSYALTVTATNGVGSGTTQNFTLTVDEVPTITSANAIAFPLNAPSSFTVTATGYPAPTFSEAGALPLGVSLNTTTGVLSGTPTNSGSFVLTLTAINSAGTSVPQSFTLAVTDPAAITSANTTTFTVGSAGTFTITATGSPTPTLGVAGSLPTGVSFDAGTGVLSGTPAAGTGGSYALTVTATNGVGSPATQNFTLIVDEAAAITSANSTTFVVGNGGTFSVTATGYPAPTLSTGGTLPGGVTFTPATGVLAGTPVAGSGGSYPITFTATNGIGSPATQGFTLIVNQPAAITSANATTFTVGTPGSFSMTASGFPTPALSLVGGLPSGVTFNPATGSLSGTPAAGTGGIYSLVLTAANGVGPDATQNFTLTVNQAPAITSAANTTFPIGNPGSFSVTSTGFPTPALSKIGLLPFGVTFVDNGDGSAALAGTPGSGTAGTWPLLITAANGVGTDATQAFTLTVTCPVITVTGTLPTAFYQTAYGPQTFTQSGGAGTPVWSATGLPAGLAIGASDGTVTGTPTTTTNGVSVAVTATDGYACTGTLTINPFKVLPVAKPDAYSTFGNTQLFAATAGPTTPYVASATNLLTNDVGPGTLVPTVVAAPAHGTIGGFSAGAFVYSPIAGDHATTDSFTYTVLDGNGVTSTPATVTISLGQSVWYINGAGAAGDGRSQTPFNSLAAASAAHLAGDMIFVESGATTTTTPGAITLKASTTLWGQGVALPLAINNTGATSKPKLTGTVTLGGSNDTVSSLDISSGASAAFANTGTITGGLVENDVTLTTTTGTALNLANASGTFTFRSISAGTAASGPTNGIVLSNSSLLTVLGDGSSNTCNIGTPTCSGGTIQKASGDAVSLTNSGAKLSLMAIKNNANSGIHGEGVPKLALTDLLVQNNTNNIGEQAGILINNLSDSAATVTRAQVSGSTEDNVRIHNSTATGTIVFDGCTVTDNSTASGNQGVFLQSNGTGKLTGTVQNSILHGNRTIALRGDAGDSSTLSATFKNNTITPGSPNQGNQGIEVSRAVTSSLTFNIDGNNVSDVISTLINVFSSGGPGSATGDVKNNIVTGTGLGGNQIGIRLFNSGSSVVGYGTMNANVANNTVSGIDNAYPILAESSGSSGTGGLLKVALTGNTANVVPGGFALDAIRAQARQTGSICARINNNTSAGGGTGFYGLQIRNAPTVAGPVFNLEGLTPGPQTDPTVINYVVAQNPGAATVGPTMGTITGVAANSCGITP